MAYREHDWLQVVTMTGSIVYNIAKWELDTELPYTTIPSLIQPPLAKNKLYRLRKPKHTISNSVAMEKPSTQPVGAFVPWFNHNSHH